MRLPSSIPYRRRSAAGITTVLACRLGSAQPGASVERAFQSCSPSSLVAVSSRSSWSEACGSFPKRRRATARFSPKIEAHLDHYPASTPRRSRPPSRLIPLILPYSLHQEVASRDGRQYSYKQPCQLDAVSSTIAFLEPFERESEGDHEKPIEVVDGCFRLLVRALLHVRGGARC